VAGWNQSDTSGVTTFQPGGKTHGEHLARIIPGFKNSGEDGFVGTSPVGLLPGERGMACYDMGGRRVAVVQRLVSGRQPRRGRKQKNVCRDPGGPARELLIQPIRTLPKRVVKGGSFLLQSLLLRELSPQFATRNAARHRFIPYRFPVRDLWRKTRKLPAWLEASLLSQNRHFLTQNNPQKLMKYKPKVVSLRSILTDKPRLRSSAPPGPLQAQDKKPNVVILMQDDTGWNDFGCYSGGGAGLGHPTPNVDRPRQGGARCSPAGTARPAVRPAAPRSSPGASPSVRRSSIVVAPGDENFLQKKHPDDCRISSRRTATRRTFSGKWHLRRQTGSLSNRARLSTR